MPVLTLFLTLAILRFGTPQASQGKTSFCGAVYRHFSNLHDSNDPILVFI